MGSQYGEIVIIGALVGAAAIATGGFGLAAAAPALTATTTGAASAGIPMTAVMAAQGASPLAAGAMTSAFSWGAALETAFTVGQAGMSVMGGFMDGAALDRQAEMSELQARQYELAGANNAVTIRRAELEELALQNARWGAAGVSLSSGTPGTVADETSAEAERQLSVNRFNTLSQSTMKRMQGSAYSSSASGSRIGGIVKGGVGLLGLAI